MSDMNVSATSSASTMTAATSSYAASSRAAETAAPAAEAKSAKDAIDGASAVYEASDAKDSKKSSTYGNPKVAEALKAANDAHIQQLQDIVSKLLTKQGDTWNTANGLKSFYENLQVDEATRLQAQKDIAEDGYWGVKQTSDRILDFAKALSGGDPEKMEEMRKAFEKGYKMATKSWGDELPGICKDTYDAVMKKFDDYRDSYGKDTVEE